MKHRAKVNIELEISFVDFGSIKRNSKAKSMVRKALAYNILQTKEYAIFLATDGVDSGTNPSIKIKKLNIL